jgi:mRNA interferase YafQ
MFRLTYTNKFLKDYRIADNRQFDLELIDEAMKILELEGSLPSSFRPHKLFGKFADCWECHIRKDLILFPLY